MIEKVTYTAIKLSVLFLYRRIFSVDKPFRIANNVLIVVMLIWGVVFLFLGSFICVGNGGVDLNGLNCAAEQWSLLWFGITEVLGDIAILSLPYPCIRKLQMNKREKVGLAAIFALGTL